MMQVQTVPSIFALQVTQFSMLLHILCRQPDDGRVETKSLRRSACISYKSSPNVNFALSIMVRDTPRDATEAAVVSKLLPMLFVSETNPPAAMN